MKRILTPVEKGKRKQLALDLPAKPPLFLRADFLSVNAPGDPLSTIDHWLASDEWRLTICGPAGCGKTHLATIVAHELGADVSQISSEGRPAPISVKKAFVIDEMERLATPKALLELIEHAKANRLRIVLAGRGHPEDWACGLRDLVTRLEAMPRIELSDPDEDTLRAVILKMFGDRQTRVNAEVIEFVAPRLPRTFDAARAFVQAADAASYQEGRAITKSLAKNVIDNLSVAPEDA